MVRIIAAIILLVSSNIAVSQAQQKCGGDGVICQGLPHGCVDMDATKCDVLAKVSTSKSSPNSVSVELSGVAKGSQNLKLTDRWIGVGFSEDGMMEKSPVVHCFEQKGQSVSKLTWNIDQGNLNIGWAGIDQSPLRVSKTSVDGDTLQCNVELQKVFTISNVPVDLNKKYFLIVATGPMMGDSVGVHDVMPETSAPKSFSF